MNIIQGLSVQGLILNTEENFNSIPGLMLWLDGSERKQEFISTALGQTYSVLKYWTSKKEPFYQFTGNTAFNINSNRINSFSTEKGVKTMYFQFSPPDGLKLGDYMRKSNVENDIAFIKNGAFGIYTISKHWKSTVAGGETNATSHIEFGSFTNNNSLFAINNTCDGVNGGIRVSYANNAVTAFNATTVLSANDNPMNSINTLAFNYKGSGVTDNYNLKINNVQKVIATHNINLQNPITGMAVGRVQNTRDATIEMFQILVYNWNGLSPTVIEQYDARIRILLEKYKLTI